MLGLLGLRIFEACGADIADIGEETRPPRPAVVGKGSKVVLVPLPPAVGRAIDQAIGTRGRGSILLNRRGRRMDRHGATRRLRHLATMSVVRLPRMPPAHAAPYLRHHHARRRASTSVTFRSPLATPTRAPPCAYDPRHARTSTDAPTTSSPPTWHRAPDPADHIALVCRNQCCAWSSARLAEHRRQKLQGGHDVARTAGPHTTEALRNTAT